MSSQVVPIFAGGLDFSGPVDRYFYNPITKNPMVDSVVSLTGFALVGGPAKQDSPKVCALKYQSKLCLQCAHLTGSREHC